MNSITMKPKIFQIEMPIVPKFGIHTLSNGTNIYLLEGGTQPIVRVDMVFRAGSVFASKCGLARAVSVLVGEGVPNMNAEQIAEKIDFYGAQIWQKSDTINSVISFIVLDKHLNNILPLIEMMIKQPTFPEKEIGIYLDKEFQNFKINIGKSRYRSSYEFTRNFYAEGSRYGRVTTEDSIHKLTRDDMVNFHKLTYSPSSLNVFVSGRPSEQSMALIDNVFGGDWGSTEPIPEPEKPILRKWKSQIMQFDRPGSMQASITMGRHLPSLPHTDLMPLNVINTIFGGYFGSRLMQNIREEKGLTYGIGSNINIRRNNSLMRIVSDVEPNNWQLVVDEIFNEMHKLQTEPITADELEMVRNYMKGQILTRYDSIMSSVDTLVPYVLEQISLDYDKQMFSIIENITSSEIQQLAQKYLVPNEFKIIVVK